MIEQGRSSQDLKWLENYFKEGGNKMAETYINELKSKLDARKKEILSQLNEEYNKILKSRFEDLESVKRNILKEVQNI
ncbi:conserved protein [Sulfolobus acidocaldarius DSM 639]|uniref:Membrane-associated ATPase epsilon chain n=4 Tax=Sulfolobus acidocaldarius TaxID=2285 RepID=MTPE_SULAC|nr:RecName: Full=Membrane-associated ATPase epsilon chain; AltName: Full=Sul-ATPase epsilon chain [Sulfolobus acidocaldarius DSM 639]AAY80864.1 conserved protein [Sulfolobus acidocaldarius DSM 639]